MGHGHAETSGGCVDDHAGGRAHPAQRTGRGCGSKGPPPMLAPSFPAPHRKGHRRGHGWPGHHPNPWGSDTNPGQEAQG
eukprot:6633724-Prorocentrum_lima.AAC.1